MIIPGYYSYETFCIENHSTFLFAAIISVLSSSLYRIGLIAKGLWDNFLANFVTLRPKFVPIFFQVRCISMGLLYSWLYIQHKFMRIQKEFLNHHSQKNKAKQRGLFYEISLLSLFQSAWQAGRNTLAA